MGSRVRGARDCPGKRCLLGIGVWVAITAGVGSAPAAAKTELLVSVAISLKESAQRIGALFEQGHPAVKVVFNVGASGALQQQIEYGAPVDVFVSAASKQMDELQAKGLILGGTRRTLAANEVVLIGPAQSHGEIGSFADLTKPHVKRIAIGNPRTVPAGQYAREVLEALRLWDSLQPKLVLTESVRQALAYVLRGEVEAGLVYATDAQSVGREVLVLVAAPKGSHRLVTYPIAVVNGSKQASLAGAFIDLALSDAGQQILRSYGFRSPPPGPK